VTLMRNAAVAAALFVCLPALLEAQQHTDRFELTEQFIRDTWVHPVRAMDVKVLGPGPVHNEENDCELHIGAELHDPTINTTRRCSGGGTNGEPFRTILGRTRAMSPSGDLATRSQMTKLYAVEGTDFFDSLGDCAAASPATNEFDVLGIFTIDALAVVKVLDRIIADHLDGQWVEVSFPVAWIVFGKMSES
jgi:hypothetical protein